MDLIKFIDHSSVALAVPEMAPTEAGVQGYIERQNGSRPFEQDPCFNLAIEHIQVSRVTGWLNLITRTHKVGDIGWA